MRLYRYDIPFTAPDRLFAAVAARPFSLFFDSADPAHTKSRYSFILFDPAETITAKDGRVIWKKDGKQEEINTCPFAFTKERLAAWDIPAQPLTSKGLDAPPFTGGAAGYFGYDLVRGIESLPASTRNHPAIPDMAIGLYDRVLAFDHHKKSASIFIHAMSEKQAQKHYEHSLKSVLANIPVHEQSLPLNWENVIDRHEYEERVEKVINYIRAGDIFQANLSQRFSAPVPVKFDPYAHYQALRAINPAPFAGYMNFGDTILSSASPERFLFVKDRHVETCPIKGTRPRHNDRTKDDSIKNELLNSLKDRSENIMIVDLMRNDLSRVCEDDPVHVPVLCGLETFAGVHHLVSTVTGKLKIAQTALDLLKACFPGGSITGAPKVRAMEIIEEIEEHRRGPYCGAMGYIGFDGTMDTNIAIRTLVYENMLSGTPTVSFNVGGGIVADSDPAAEYKETLDKAGRIFESFLSQNEGEEAA